MRNFYKFKFYINARHSVEFNNIRSNIHPHTWETVVHIEVNSEDFINFTSFEKVLEKYFDKYEGKYFNDIPHFQDINPTMENIGKKVFIDLEEMLSKSDLRLVRLEISENPTRTYIIDDR